jgi:hypothetical protein
MNRRSGLRTIRSFILLFFCSLLSTCTHVSGPEQPDEQTSLGIIPLKVGYYWNYATFALSEDSSIGPQNGSAKFEIVRISINPTGGETLFHWADVNPNTNRPSDFEWLYRNQSDGLYMFGGKMPTDSIFTRILLYKFPVAKGETWMSPHLVYDLLQMRYTIPDTLVYKCVDADAEFDTPVGVFSCTVYYHRIIDNEGDVVSTQDLYEYYAKGVGHVGTVTLTYAGPLKKMVPLSRTVLTETNIITR